MCLANRLAAGAGLGLPEQVNVDYALGTSEVYTRYAEFFIVTYGAVFFSPLLPRPQRIPPPPVDSSKVIPLAGLLSWRVPGGII